MQNAMDRNSIELVIRGKRGRIFYGMADARHQEEVIRMKKYKNQLSTIIIVSVLASFPILAQATDAENGTDTKSGNNVAPGVFKSHPGTPDQSHGSLLTPPNSNPGRGYKGGVEANNPPPNSP